MKFVVILFLCIFVALANDALAAQSVVAETGTAEASAAATASAGGHEAKGAKHSESKHAKKSGKSSKHDVEKAHKGQKQKELHKKVAAEGAGKKTKHHDEGGHKSHKLRVGGGGHGGKFLEASKRKKLNYKKGFREKYHKDEEKKHNTFYSNGHKSGEFEIFGQKHSKHNSKFLVNKKVENHKAGGDQNDHKKSSAQVGGHDVSGHKGHKNQQGAKSHHSHEEKWAKKGGKKGGKQYKYKVPPHK